MSAGWSLPPLDRAGGPEEAGGKAAALGALAREGWPVPPGFVVPAAAFAALLRGGPGEALAALKAQVPDADAPALAAIAAEARQLVAEAPWPEGLEGALLEAWRGLGAPKVAVRSSGLGEDGRAASFAGQLDSVLDVEDAAGLMAAARRVWASAFGARALAYQRASGVRLEGLALLVQAQIEGAVSGVAFTRAPQDPARLLIEHVEGGCEALVSGAATPEATLLRRQAWREDGAAAASERLPPERLAALVEALLGLEAARGAPQDVEWTFDPQGRLHVLQARPITAERPRPAPEAAVYSDANINENYPGPVTPLLQSIARTSYAHYFRSVGIAYGFAPWRLEAMQGAFEALVGVHGQRLYYDLSNLHAVLRMAPFGEVFAGWFNRFVGAEERTAPRPGDLTWRWGDALELAPMLASVLRHHRRLSEGVVAFETEVEGYAAATTHEALEGLDARGLLAHVRGFMDIRRHRWTGAALADGACMVCSGALEAFLARRFDEPADVLLHGLLRGLPDIVSSEPPRALWRLSRDLRARPELRAQATPGLLEALGWDGRRFTAEDPFARAVQGYLDDWGHRCTGELMLTVDSFQERPGPVLDMLRAYAAMEGEGPDAAIAAQGAERLALTARLAGALPWPWRRAFLALTRAMGKALSLRERARLKQALLYRRHRRVVLALGRRLHADGLVEAPDDPLFMTWQELLALEAPGARPPRHAIAARRRTFVEQSAWPAPPHRLVLPRGEAWRPPATPPAPRAEAGPRLFGVAAAAGKVQARAAVTRSQEDFHLVAAGDVLVAPQTDPGWATVLFLVRGLVVERGGMLSHGAIVAREFGIPSVVGVPEATARIPHGAQVRVDGDEGHVELL